jgi:hypothetical protein
LLAAAAILALNAPFFATFESILLERGGSGEANELQERRCWACRGKVQFHHGEVNATSDDVTTAIDLFDYYSKIRR